jgi:diacylglycerol kinase family enzyme
MEYLFVQSLAEICEHSFVAPDRPLRCMVVANPAAGGFAVSSRWKSHLKTLNEYRDKAKANPRRQLYKNIVLNLTVGKGCARELTMSYVKRVEKDPVPFYLIISAGGDGTHGEVMHALYDAPAHIRSNVAVLRLPFGTGNDNSENPSLAKTLDLLINPVNVVFSPAVQLTTNSSGPANDKGPFLAFNILSAGLDAFVTHMTNKMKGKLPGDSYKLWINAAALFYDLTYKVDNLNIRALDDNNKEIQSFNDKMLLLAMGVSGNRTYGSQQLILPDTRNVCSIKQMPLHRKLAIKSQVTRGKHINNPEVFIYNAHRLEFSSSHPILAQMDGETILLQPGDFPAVMELTAPAIPLLKME